MAKAKLTKKVIKVLLSKPEQKLEQQLVQYISTDKEIVYKTVDRSKDKETKYINLCGNFISNYRELLEDNKVSWTMNKVFNTLRDRGSMNRAELIQTIIAHSGRDGISLTQVEKELQTLTDNRIIYQTSNRDRFKDYLGSMDPNKVTYEQYLSSRKMRDYQNNAQQKKVAKSFKNYLKNFGSFVKFKAFLSRCSEPSVKTFYLNIKKDIFDNGSYTKYLNFCNYTIDSQRVLIMSTYQHYFSNVPKRTMTKIVTRGIVAKAMKSERRKKIDAGLIKVKKNPKDSKQTKYTGTILKEYTYIIEVALGEVARFLKFNGPRLRGGVGIDYNPEYQQSFGKKQKVEGKIIKAKLQKPGTVPGIGNFKHFKQKLMKAANQTFSKNTMSEIIKDYSYLRTYTFKMINPKLVTDADGKMHGRISAFGIKNKMVRLVKNKRNRAVKFEEKFGQDWSVILAFFRKLRIYQFADEFSKEARKEMTLALKMLKLKKYSTLSTLITSTVRWDRLEARDKSIQFVEEFKVKKLTHKHIK